MWEQSKDFWTFQAKHQYLVRTTLEQPKEPIFHPNDPPTPAFYARAACPSVNRLADEGWQFEPPSGEIHSLPLVHCAPFSKTDEIWVSLDHANHKIRVNHRARFLPLITTANLFWPAGDTAALSPAELRFSERHMHGRFTSNAVAPSCIPTDRAGIKTDDCLLLIPVNSVLLATEGRSQVFVPLNSLMKDAMFVQVLHVPRRCTSLDTERDNPRNCCVEVELPQGLLTPQQVTALRASKKFVVIHLSSRIYDFAKLVGQHCTKFIDDLVDEEESAAVVDAPAIQSMDVPASNNNANAAIVRFCNMGGEQKAETMRDLLQDQSRRVVCRAHDSPSWTALLWCSDFVHR